MEGGDHREATEQRQPKPESSGSRLLDAARNTLGNLKKAGVLSAKVTEREFQKGGLNNAYRALGRHVYEAGTHRDAIPEAHQEIDQFRNEVAEIEKRMASAPESKGMADKAKSLAGVARDRSQIQLIKSKISSRMEKLGKAAFQRDGKGCGPNELVQPVLECLAKIERLDQEIADLSASRPGEVLTPKRIALAAIAIICLIGVGMLFRGGSGEKVAAEQSGERLVAAGQRDQADVSVEDTGGTSSSFLETDPKSGASSDAPVALEAEPSSAASDSPVDDPQVVNVPEEIHPPGFFVGWLGRVGVCAVCLIVALFVVNTRKWSSEKKGGGAELPDTPNA